MNFPRSLEKQDDLYIARRAMEQGWVSQEQVLDCLLDLRACPSPRSGPAGFRPLVERLLARGYLRSADFQKILSEQKLSVRLSALEGREADAGGRAGENDAGEIERAVALYLKQKNMVRRQALEEAQEFQKEAAGYGLAVPILEILKRREMISWRQLETLKTIDFEKVTRSPAWRGQSIPGYRIVRKIASGGFATLFAGQPVFGSRWIAVKLLRPERARNAATVERFRQEAMLMMKLDHPHLVKAYEYGEHGGLPYIILELVEGSGVESLVLEKGPLPVAQALRVARQVAEAANYLQQEGYIHRDLKPENILLDKEGNAKVCDLGFALLMGEGGVAPGKTTLGTAAFMSPEQARGERDLKIGTDMYSLGLTLYFMLSGSPPFTGHSSEIILTERFSDGVAAPDFSVLRVSEPVLDLLRRMLHPDRSQRFRSYPDLIAALNRIIAR